MACFALFLSAAGCGSERDAPAPVVPSEPASTASGDAPLPEVQEFVPIPPASAWLHGAFEHRGSHLGREFQLGVRFEDGQLARTNQGRVTASEEYEVLEDRPGRIVLELSPSEGPAKIRELVFDGADVLWDAAAPELQYVRIAHGAPDEPADGSGD